MPTPRLIHIADPWALTRLLCALAALTLLTGAAPAEPEPRFELLGYRIVVEPEIVVSGKGALATRALHWRLRMVYRSGAGGPELLVRVSGPAAPRDGTVRVQRATEAGDVPRTSALFVDRKLVLRRFAGLRQSPDITLIAAAGGAGVDRLPPSAPPVETTKPKHEPKPKPKPEPAKTCRELLVDQGHHASHLDKCRGVDAACAAALLKRGHHPTHLDKCRGVQPRCAVTLLGQGHHPAQLSKCTIDLRPRCAKALLQAGHHPALLQHCSGVDDACAVALLERGDHPSKLRECR